MTDTTPAPESGLPILSIEQVIALEKQLRENKAAQLRGEPLPHSVTPEQVRDAVMAMRRQRGTLDLATSRKSGGGSKKASGGKAASIEILDLGDL